MISQIGLPHFSNNDPFANVAATDYSHDSVVANWSWCFLNNFRITVVCCYLFTETLVPPRLRRFLYSCTMLCWVTRSPFSFYRSFTIWNLYSVIFSLRALFSAVAIFSCNVSASTRLVASTSLKESMSKKVSVASSEFI